MLLQNLWPPFFHREQAETETGDGGPVCTVCYVSRPQVIHQPCGHRDFCLVCSLQCEACPLCRAPIADRQELVSDSAEEPTAYGEALDNSEAGAEGNVSGNGTHKPAQTATAAPSDRGGGSKRVVVAEI